MGMSWVVGARRSYPQNIRTILWKIGSREEGRKGEGGGEGMTTIEWVWVIGEAEG